MATRQEIMQIAEQRAKVSNQNLCIATQEYLRGIKAVDQQLAMVQKAISSTGHTMDVEMGRYHMSKDRQARKALDYTFEKGIMDFEDEADFSGLLVESRGLELDVVVRGDLSSRTDEIRGNIGSVEFHIVRFQELGYLNLDGHPRRQNPESLNVKDIACITLYKGIENGALMSYAKADELFMCYGPTLVDRNNSEGKLAVFVPNPAKTYFEIASRIQPTPSTR
ncbi:MAG TPA: hypothetical protein VG965_01675 [Patescibacteria group bacterium]|nr:hypothetical protein [Patescibacteria group bacterium]